MQKRFHGIFYGNVIGVGFRAAVYDICRGLRLNGFVQNAENGVEMIVEGEEKAINELLELLNERFEVSNMDSEMEESKKEFKKFEIRND